MSREGSKVSRPSKLSYLISSYPPTDASYLRTLRLMYWPSTSKDGKYIFDHQDGPWLSADNMLSSYKDWRNREEWPVLAKSMKQ